MIESRGSRLAALALVLATLSTALVAFGTLDPNPAAGRYPATTDVVGHEARYRGESVEIGATVVATDPLVVADDYAVVRDGEFLSGTARFTVVDATPQLTPGDDVQVFGTLTGARTIHASNTVLVTGDSRYMYLVSFLAGLWVLTRLARQWRLDPQRLAVVPREEPLTVRSILAPWRTSTEEARDA